MSERSDDMDLLLWRHAEAEDGVDDGARALTRRGRRQAERVGAWLRERLPHDALVLASPARRTRQTAEALHRDFRISEGIGTGASAADALKAAGWPGRGGTVLIVGHQPTLGNVASLLLSGTEADWSVRKGALWWVSVRRRAGRTQTALRAVVSPDIC